MEPVVSPIRQREARPRFITSLYQDMDLKTLAIEKEGGLMFRAGKFLNFLRVLQYVLRRQPLKSTAPVI